MIGWNQVCPAVIGESLGVRGVFGVRQVCSAVIGWGQVCPAVIGRSPVLWAVIGGCRQGNTGRPQQQARGEVPMLEPTH